MAGRGAWAARTFAALGVLGWAVGCGDFNPDDPLDGPQGSACYQDQDCIPENCCGDSSTVRHRADGPDCSAVQCTQPPTLLGGCGIPVCRSDGHCGVAIKDDPGC